MNFDFTFKATGDPFVDTGALVLEYLHEKHPDKTIEEFVKNICKIIIYQ